LPQVQSTRDAESLHRYCRKKGEFGGDRAAQSVGRPEEIAQTIIFLAFERASFITGASYLVDGGKTAR
jgi:NAD(P)-dependent dehydrogenase (short-subunit alcohol dehydrogenase family)